MKCFIWCLSFWLGIGLCCQVKADNSMNRKPVLQDLVIRPTKGTNGTRSISMPIIGTFDPKATTLTLYSTSHSGMAHITISGPVYLIETVYFGKQNVSLDISELTVGIYTITIEFEEGKTGIGQFELYDWQ